MQYINKIYKKYIQNYIKYIQEVYKIYTKYIQNIYKNYEVNFFEEVSSCECVI